LFLHRRSSLFVFRMDGFCFIRIQGRIQFLETGKQEKDGCKIRKKEQKKKTDHETTESARKYTFSIIRLSFSLLTNIRKSDNLTRR
ncbi:MAG: hypothetical protein ACOCZ2_01365, partial [Thermodesulfobacteriota bacterium]